MKLTAENTFVDKVTDLLKLEADAITRAAEQLQPSQVERAIAYLVACQGKVVVSGVGKSGIVARKIAATMTSTGTLATYLHPGDALHGDLGIVTGEDVAIVLSNSGETDEIIAMLPYLQHRKVPIIAILGNLDSTLGRRADVVLDASVAREACPLNLAPTASTTVALAVGDAIAMTLMQAKALTPEDFAQNHPAGRLGKRLTLRIEDLMHNQADNPTISPQSSWIEVVSQISQGGLGAVNVVDETGRLLGVITDGDLRRAVQNIDPKELDQLYAGKIMTRDPIVALPSDFAYDALQMMENRNSPVSVLPIVDQERMCVGIIRLHDIVRSGL